MPMNATYLGPGDLPEVIAVFPLAGALLLPRGQLPLNILEPRYLMMIDDAFTPGRPRVRLDPTPPAASGAGGQAQSLRGRLRGAHHAADRDRRRSLHDPARGHRPLPRRG